MEKKIVQLEKEDGEKGFSVDPSSEQDLCFGIRQDRRAKAQTTWARNAVLKLNIVRRHDMCEHSLQLVCSEETSGTTKRYSNSQV